MTIDIENGLITARNSAPRVYRRDTNTSLIHLETDEVLALIQELAAVACEGGPVYLVVEQDTITSPRSL